MGDILYLIVSRIKTLVPLVKLSWLSQMLWAMDNVAHLQVSSAGNRNAKLLSEIGCQVDAWV